jgi:hypothetical protein
MNRYITITGVKYLIRGPYTAREVRQRYTAFMQKYPDSKLTLAQWAAQRGAVYTDIRNPQA